MSEETKGMTLQELVYCIQNAAEELEVKTRLTFEEIVNANMDKDGFLAGHILGMRDCLTIVATLSGIKMENEGEEE